MRISNSLIVPKNVKGGTLGFINIHSVAKHQKIEGDFLVQTKFWKNLIELKKRQKLKHQDSQGGSLDVFEVLDVSFVFCFGRGSDNSSSSMFFKLLDKWTEKWALPLALTDHIRVTRI